jgi:hypothetical protein
MCLQAFLVPFNLGASKDATVSAAGTKDDYALRRAKANASNVLLACTDVDKPFPIMTGTVFNPPGDDGYRLYPLEVRTSCSNPSNHILMFYWFKVVQTLDARACLWVVSWYVDTQHRACSFMCTMMY